MMAVSTSFWKVFCIEERKSSLAQPLPPVVVVVVFPIFLHFGGKTASGSGAFPPEELLTRLSSTRTLVTLEQRGGKVREKRTSAGRRGEK